MTFTLVIGAGRGGLIGRGPVLRAPRHKCCNWADFGYFVEKAASFPDNDRTANRGLAVAVARRRSTRPDHQDEFGKLPTSLNGIAQSGLLRHRSSME